MIISEQDKTKNRVKPEKESFFKTEEPVPPVSQIQEPVPIVVPKENVIEQQPVLLEQEQPQKKTAADYFKELTTITPEKPVYDPNRPEELRRLSRNNAIAKGFNMIGDIAAVHQGANVNVRRPDNMEAKYTNDMYKYLDDYADRTDRWNWQNFTSKLNNARMGISQANTDRTFGANEDWRDTQTARANRQDTNREKLTDAQIEDRKRDDARQVKRDAEYSRHNKEMEKRYGRTTDKSDKPLIIRTKDGKEHSFTPQQASLLRDEAIVNREQLIEINPHLFERTPILDFHDNPTGEYEWSIARSTTEEDLIRAYIEMQRTAEGNYNRVARIKGKMDKKLQGIRATAPAEAGDDYSDIEF